MKFNFGTLWKAGRLISILVEAELRVQQNSDTTHGEGATCLLQNY